MLLVQTGCHQPLHCLQVYYCTLHPPLPHSVCIAAFHVSAAGSLADETGSEPLSDMHIFRQAQRVIDSLRQHDCSAALTWCADNRVRLKKVKSSLEFKLRMQEFLELVAQVSTRDVHTRGCCLI